jgi:hypothetical protein
MIALNRCPPGRVQRSSCQRHSPRSAGTCLPFSSQAQLPDRWIPAKRLPSPTLQAYPDLVSEQCQVLGDAPLERVVPARFAAHLVIVTDGSVLRRGGCLSQEVHPARGRRTDRERRLRELLHRRVCQHAIIGFGPGRPRRLGGPRRSTRRPPYESQPPGPGRPVTNAGRA